MEEQERALHLQRETLRAIQRYFLLPLQKNVDLGSGENKPTLATMTRFHRLRKLNARLQDLIECGGTLCHWLEGNENSTPEAIVNLVKKHISQTHQASKCLSDNWISAKIVLDAAYCTKHVKAMEFKITQFHNHLEDILKIYISLMTNIYKSPDRKKLTKLPIDIRKLDNIEVSMPPKYVTHSAKTQNL